MSTDIEIVEPYHQTEDGSIYVLSKSGEQMFVVVNAFLNVLAFMMAEGSKNWKMLVEFLNIDGESHRVWFTLADLHTRPNEVLRQFLSRGLRLGPSGKKHLPILLQSLIPKKRYLQVLHTGWLSDSWIFVMPNRVIGNVDIPVHFEPEKNSPTINSMYQQGKCQDWRAHIAEPLQGKPVAMFALMAAFLGPLLKPLGIDGGGFHFWGRSSVGKTTLLQIAGSVWGYSSSPATEATKSFVQLWNQTSNGLEAVSACHSDMLILLDEIGLYAGSDLGADLYLLASGRGKVSMDSQRNLRDTRSWRGNILSTGEVPVSAAIEKNGKKAKAGQLLRLIDIHVDNLFPISEEE